MRNWQTQRLQQALEPLMTHRGVMQVGILVKDIAAGMAYHSAIWRVGPWRCYTYDPDFVPDLSYRGARGEYSMRLALAGEKPEIELIEPVRGPSIYEEWMNTNGEGLHHLGFGVSSLDLAIDVMAKEGYELIQAGRGYGVDRDGGYGYFDTIRDFGLVVEAIELPRTRRPPELIWPSDRV